MAVGVVDSRAAPWIRGEIAHPPNRQRDEQRETHDQGPLCNELRGGAERQRGDEQQKADGREAEGQPGTLRLSFGADVHGVVPPCETESNKDDHEPN